MSISLLVAVRGRAETTLVTALGASHRLTVVRRCADLPELLAAAASGVASVALLSDDLPLLDRTALAELARHGVAVVGVFEPATEDGERRLRQLGLDVVVPVHAALADVEDAVSRVHAPAGIGDGAGAGDIRTGAGNARRGPYGENTSGDAARDGGGDGGGDVGGDGDDREDTNGIVVAVWGPTGAPGRSLTALTIADEIAATGRATLLVDADQYGGVQAQALALLGESSGIAAATRSSDQGTLDLAELRRLAPEALPNLRVLTGLPKADRWPELRAAPLRHVLSLARRLAEIVVVDCGFCLEDDEELSYDTLAPRRNAATLTVLADADEVLVVGAADPIGLQRLVRALDALDRAAESGALGGSASRRTVVVNKVRASAVGSDPDRVISRALDRFAGVASPRLVPDDRSSVDAALLAGRTLREQSPGSPARAALRSVAHGLVGAPEQDASQRARPGRRRRRASV